MPNQFVSGANLKKAKFRDFKYEKLFGVATAIPNEYSLRKYIKVKDQKDTDMCCGFGSSILADLHEGVETDPLYLFAKIKQIEGNLGWGAEIQSGMKALVKYGALEQLLSPYTLNDKTRDWLANWKNWDTVYDVYAKGHLQKSYFSVKNGFEYYKSALWKGKDKKDAILTGVMWQSGWQNAKNGVISFEGQQQGGHIIAVVGFKNDYLEIVNSYSENVGDVGFYYVHKDIVNKYFVWLSGIVVDMTPEEAKQLVWGTKEVLWNAIIKTTQTIISKLYDILNSTRSLASSRENS